MRRKESSAKACAGLSSLIKNYKFILSFPSFGSEIDLWPLNQELSNQGRLVLPRLSGQELQLYQVDILSHLEPHSWGQLEPVPSLCRPFELSSIEIALVPGLGFDFQTLHRLGYGGGYYDRLFANAHHVLKWGIGFSEQAVEGLPYDEGDIQLDQILLF